MGGPYRALRCAEADLGPLARLDGGGESTIFEIERIPGCLYKRYTEARNWEQDLGVLVGLPARMAEPHRILLSSHAAWPQMGVTDRDGRAVGCVIPRAPDEHWFAPFRTRTVRPIAELFFPHRMRDRVRWPALDEVIAVLRQLAELVSVLHGYGIAIGDISHANCTFALDPAPAVFAIDCDSYFAPTAMRDRYRETPDWEDPAGRPPGYMSDDYKLALVVARVLSGDRSVHPAGTEAAQGPYGTPSRRVRELLAEAGADGPNPSARDWAVALGSTRVDLPTPWIGRYESPLAAAMCGEWDEAASMLATHDASPAVTRIIHAHLTGTLS